MRDYPKCGNWNCTNVEKRYVLAIFMTLNSYNLHSVICKTIGLGKPQGSEKHLYRLMAYVFFPR